MSRIAHFLAAFMLVLLVTAGVRAEDVKPATLLPAEGVVAYIEIDDLAKLRADAAKDPLIAYLKSEGPGKEDPAWLEVQTMMGLSGDEIVDRYFGKKLAIIGGSHEPGGKGFLLSAVSKDDAALAIDKLKLEKLADAGDFAVYKTKDNKGRIAFGGGWMAMSDAKHEDYFKSVLAQLGKGPSLAENPDFKTWSDKLPASRQAEMLVHDRDGHGYHALAAVWTGRDVILHYAGTSDSITELLGKIGDAKATAWGPLPSSTIALMSWNIYEKSPDPRQAAIMDRLVAPASFAKDVVPKLAAPAVVFLGELKSEQLDPAPGFSVPVFGATVKMKDATVAADLDRAVNGVLVLANLATLRWKTDPIAMGQAEYAGQSYHTADLGAAISQAAKKPELKAVVKIAYGRVGDYYVICTHEAYFKQCLDTLKAGEKLGDAADVKAMGLKESASPIGTGLLRPGLLAAHVQTWLSRIEKDHPELTEQSKLPEPPEGPARGLKAARVLSGVLRYYKGMNMQLTRDGEGVLRGQINIQRQ